MQYSDEEIFNTVKKIIVDVCPYVDVNRIKKDALLRQHLGLDGYDIIDITFEIEQHYGKLFDIDRLESSRDLGTFCRILSDELNVENKSEQIVTMPLKRINLLNRIKLFFTRQKQQKTAITAVFLLFFLNMHIHLWKRKVQFIFWKFFVYCFQNIRLGRQ